MPEVRPKERRRKQPKRRKGTELPARTRLREQMRRFVNSFPGRNLDIRKPAAAKACGWSEGNVKKAYDPGSPDWLPGSPALLRFCEAAGVSLQELLHGEARPTDLEVALEEYLRSKLSQRLPGAALHVDVSRVLGECVDDLERRFREHQTALRRHHSVHRPLWDLLDLAIGVQGAFSGFGMNTRALDQIVDPAAAAVREIESTRDLFDPTIPAAPPVWYASWEEEVRDTWPASASAGEDRPLIMSAQDAVEGLIKDIAVRLGEDADSATDLPGKLEWFRARVINAKWIRERSSQI